MSAFICLFVHSWVYWLLYFLISALIYLFIYSCIYLLIYLFIFLLISLLMCAFMYLCVCVFVYAFLLLWKCGNVGIKNKGATYQSTNAPFYLTVPPNRRNLVALEIHIWNREGGVGLFAVFLTHGNGDIGRVT